MKNIIFLFIFATVFIACGSKSLENQWKIKSINAFNSYKINFLSSKDNLAKTDLKRAINHAKVSSNLSTLARIYLGECALNISVGEKTKCEKYKKIEHLVDDKKLSSYYRFLQLLYVKNDIKNLPIQYKSFAKNLLEKKYKDANKDILNMKKPSSKFIAAILIKYSITKEVLVDIIDTASLYGYKKSVIYFLGEYEKKIIDVQEKENIIEKIKILQGNL